MKRRIRPSIAVVVLLAAVALGGCPKVEQAAYDLVVGTKASLVKYRASHPECAFDATTGLSPNVKVAACTLNNRITAGKDAIIDAAEVYCSGKDFENGGVCNPPAKGSDAATQAGAKLQAATRNLQQILKDTKGAF